MRPSSGINVSSKSDLNCSLLISYIYIFPSYHLLSVRECGGVPSVVVWVSLYQVGWRLSETKACLCSSISFALPWWESSAPLIVFGVLGQGTPISLCSGEGVWASALVCVRVAPAFVQQLRTGALSFSPMCRSPLCAHAVAPVSLEHAVTHNGGNNLHNRSVSPGCLFTLWW